LKNTDIYLVLHERAENPTEVISGRWKLEDALRDARDFAFVRDLQEVDPYEEGDTPTWGDGFFDEVIITRLYVH
jgi:hypothetical protein